MMPVSAFFAGSYKGKTAIVTGAASGIGRAVSSALAALGAAVVAVDTDETGLHGLAAEAPNRIEPMPMSVTDRALVAVFAETWDKEPVHLLVNAAGVFPRSFALDDDFATAWETALKVNLTGAMGLTRALVPGLAAGGGAVVNIASILGQQASAGSAGYGVSKAGVAQLTRAFAVELGEMGIRVNAVAPGPVRTPMTATALADAVRVERYLQRTPLGRIAKPADIVGPVLFLGSEAAGHVTGAVLPVDGGYLAA